MSDQDLRWDVIVDQKGIPQVVIELLAPLVELDDDWDGYGALAPRAGALKAAADVLVEWGRSIPSPQVMASVAGGVLLEWESRDVDLVVDVGAEGSVSVYVRACDAESEGPLDEHRQEAEQALALLALTS